MKARLTAYDFNEDASLNAVVDVVRKDGTHWHCVKAQLMEADKTIKAYQKKAGSKSWEEK